MAAEPGKLLLYVGLGQSLLALVPRTQPLPVRPAPLDAGRAFVFSPNGSARLHGNPLAPLDMAELADLHPHQSHPLASPMTEATRVLLRALSRQDAVLTVNLARRGATIEEFGAAAAAATHAHANLRAVLIRAEALARERGLLLGRMVVSWVQGQANRNAGLGTYQAALAALLADISALHAEVTGQGGGVTMVLTQNTAISPGHRRCIGAEQWRAVLASGGQMLMAGPEYMLERADGLHLTARSAASLGALHGRAIAAHLTGQDFTPLHMAEARRDGARIVIRFDGGAGDLVHDAASANGGYRIGVRPLPFWGFVWVQRGGLPAALAEVHISAPREVTLTLDRDPGTDVAGIIRLGLAPARGLPEGFVQGDPATAKGGGTNLRSSRGHDIYGQTLHDWAVQQSIPVG